MKFTYPENAPKSLSERVSAVESVLFAAGEPVERAGLARSLGLEAEELEEALAVMRARYASVWSGLVLSETKDSLQLRSSPANHSYVERALSLNKRKPLTKASSEALAVIAYNGPVTRVDVDAIRGVNSTGAIMRLLDQGLIEECGEKEAPGRPKLYRPSDEFLRLAGVESLEELPSFESFRRRLNESEVEQNE